MFEQSAGNAVKRATEALVREAQQMRGAAVEEVKVTVNQRMVSNMAQVSNCLSLYYHLHHPTLF